MKCAYWMGPQRIEIVEIDKPEPRQGEVLIRVESVGICGSDMHYYLEGRIGDQVVTPPLILGHEFSGIVEAVTDHSHEHLLGKRVAVEPGIPCWECEFCQRGKYNVCPYMRFLGGPGCDGALREYITVPARMCFVVPDGMDAESASMVEPLAVAVHALELAKIVPGESALVVGLGSIGLLTAQLLLHSNVSQVLGIDLITYRAEIAKQLGVGQVYVPVGSDKTKESIEWIQAMTGGRGVDVAFDCTNQSEGIVVTCGGTKPAGRCILVGISGKDLDYIPVSIARRRELCLQWCRRFCFNFPASIDLLHRGKVNLSPILTHRFAFEEVELAFNSVAFSTNNLIKATINVS